MKKIDSAVDQFPEEVEYAHKIVISENKEEDRQFLQWIVQLINGKFTIRTENAFANKTITAFDFENEIFEVKVCKPGPKTIITFENEEDAALFKLSWK